MTLVVAHRGASAHAPENTLDAFRQAVEMGAGEGNSLETTIAHVSYLGEIEQYQLELSSAAVIKAFEQNPQEIRRVGQPLTIHIRPQNLLLLPGP